MIKDELIQVVNLTRSIRKKYSKSTEDLICSHVLFKCLKEATHGIFDTIIHVEELEYYGYFSVSEYEQMLQRLSKETGIKLKTEKNNCQRNSYFVLSWE